MQEEPVPPAEHVKRAAVRLGPNWISEDAKQRINNFLRKSGRDENDNPNHRTRLHLGMPSSEVRISHTGYDDTARRLIADGWTLVKRQGQIQILDQSITKDVSWGLNATALRDKAKQIQWPDKDLQRALTFGFEDHSETTPPIPVASPHQLKALRNKKDFETLIEKEIRNGWYAPPTQGPITLLFRLTPGSIELKTTVGKFRLIRNSSWPKPGTHESLITNGADTRPLATNACTTLPSFMQFEWTSIDSNNKTILIFADLAKTLGTKVTGITIDFTDWFRQLATSKKDFWKASVVTRDGVRTDKRLQMGRKSSAIHGQRLSFLIAEIVEQEAEDQAWGRESLTDVQRTQLQKW